jgi:hypothetical protein
MPVLLRDLCCAQNTPATSLLAHLQSPCLYQKTHIQLGGNTRLPEPIAQRVRMVGDSERILKSPALPHREFERELRLGLSFWTAAARCRFSRGSLLPSCSS